MASLVTNKETKLVNKRERTNKRMISSAVITCLALVSLTSGQSAVPDFGLLSDDEIYYINNIAKTTWKAGRNFHPNAKERVKNLVGKKRPGMLTPGQMAPFLQKKGAEAKPVQALPVNFDARIMWPNCSTLIGKVSDQGACNSAWAMTIATVMTDRFCIATSGKFQSQLSAQNMLACSEYKEFSATSCNRGYTEEAWAYMSKTGTVTGGDYNSKEGCQPYYYPPCDHDVTGNYHECSELTVINSRCYNTNCTNTAYNKTYQKDIHTASKPYVLSSEERAMEEIVLEGSIQAAMAVYADFFQYKSGIYQHVSGAELGYHLFKIIGYGVENNVKYWLAVNTWNTDWGNKGMFKVLRDSRTVPNSFISAIPVII